MFMATVASASPYIGLFGTVWGIMGSFGTAVTDTASDPGNGRALDCRKR